MASVSRDCTPSEGVSAPAGAARRKLTNVQAGRGIGALLVVAFHADAFYFGTPGYWPAPFLSHFFAFGHAGVFFFFVLSGFIILTAHRADIGVPARAASFCRKRFTRLYPFYWLVLAVSLALLIAVPSFGHAKNRAIGNVLGSIVLAGINPLDATIFVSWTLFYEILFYALFASLILSRRAGIAVLGLWWAACALCAVLGLAVPYPLGVINLLFSFGVLVAVLAERGRLAAGSALTLIGAALFVATGMDDVYLHALSPALSALSYGLWSAVTLAGLVTIERDGRIAPAWLSLIGDASYALYLTHMLGLAFGAKTLRAVHATHWLPTLPAFVLLCLAAIATGIAAHLLLERPLVRLARRMVGD